MFQIRETISKQLLTCGGETVTSFCKDLHEIFSEISTCKILSKYGVRKCIPFIYWYCVRFTITRVKNNSCLVNCCLYKKYINGHYKNIKFLLLSIKRITFDIVDNILIMVFTKSRLKS